MANEISLREAFNRVDVTGILAEKNLEVKTFTNGEAIVGDLVIKTGVNSFIKLKVFSNRLTKSGAESKAFTAFTTVMREYKSIAETGNEELADKVTAFGKLAEGKPFVNQNSGDVVVSLANQISFISRVTNPTVFEPKAKWQGEVFVQSYQNEMKKEDGGEELVETGRKIMNVVVPTYGGKVFPMKLILEEEGAEWFEDNVKRNSTIKVYCDLINSTEKVVQGSTEGGFGKKDPQVITKVINERVVVGADDAYPDFEEGEESQKAYDPQVITQALAIREQAIEEAKNVSTQPPKAQTGFGSRPATPTAQTMEETDDIPF